MKNNKNYIFENLKTKKLLQKQPKQIKKSYQEASNKEVQKKLWLEFKNIKNDIFENFKNSKMTPKTHQNQNYKKFKSHVMWPEMKKFRKQATVRIDNIKNDIFDNFLNSKFTPRRTFPKISKT